MKVQLLVKVEKETKDSLQTEAKSYGLSLSDVVRLKLRKPLTLEEVLPYQVPQI